MEGCSGPVLLVLKDQEGQVSWWGSVGSSLTPPCPAQGSLQEEMAEVTAESLLMVLRHTPLTASSSLVHSTHLLSIYLSIYLSSILLYWGLNLGPLQYASSPATPPSLFLRQSLAELPRLGLNL